MTITNPDSGTNVHEIPPPIPPSVMPGGFTFNQFLIVDEEPLLFHTGPKQMFPLVQQAVTHVLGDITRLRHLSFSHIESDECGSANQWLAAAPQAQVSCG